MEKKEEFIRVGTTLYKIVDQPRLGEARAWDYKQCQREDSKFVFRADRNRLLSFC